jgi:colanic acid/amylovoran biosynthesis glycosyltransferase
VLTVAYLANQFPSAVEPYVTDEIAELRRRGVQVIAGSARKPSPSSGSVVPEIVLQSVSVNVLLQGAWLCFARWKLISDLLARVLFQGTESLSTRGKTLLHTWLGACYAVCLRNYRPDHIHVHHGYFASWIALVAARLLDIGFSLTLHGSDLLLNARYLDVKLEHCRFCLTVSEFNRSYLLSRFPSCDSRKIVACRLGVDPGRVAPRERIPDARFKVLAVGRLHPVKDHAFLVQAMGELTKRNVDVECCIAGDGPERGRLEKLIRKLGLQDRVRLLGHVRHDHIDCIYDWADVVVLTSQSEGIPLVLMEAMARRRIVLAPEITGIPELVIHDRTGFLYQPGSLAGFVDQLLSIFLLLRTPSFLDVHSVSTSPPHRRLEWIRHAARVQVLRNFNRSRNLESFAELFLTRITPEKESLPDADLVLQQI